MITSKRVDNTMKKLLKTASILLGGLLLTAAIVPTKQDIKLPSGFMEIPHANSETMKYVLNTSQIVKVERKFDGGASLERGADKAWFILVDLSSGRSLKIYDMTDEEFWTRVKRAR